MTPQRLNPNVWPDNLPGFRETVTDYHQRIERLARQFLPLWATSLNLPLDYFEKYFATPHLLLSLLYYPPQKEIGNRQYGIAPHTDNSLMTFLAQADVSGLAVRMPSGHWRAVDIIPGTLLVNTGNLMVRWTNGEYLSTKHRVINTNDVDRLLDPCVLRPERRRADRVCADLPGSGAATALRTDHVSGAAPVVLRDVGLTTRCCAEEASNEASGGTPGRPRRSWRGRGGRGVPAGLGAAGLGRACLPGSRRRRQSDRRRRSAALQRAQSRWNSDRPAPDLTRAIMGRLGISKSKGLSAPTAS